MDKRQKSNNLSSEKGSVSTSVYVSTIIIMFIAFLVVLGIVIFHYYNEVKELKLTQPTEIKVEEPTNDETVSLEDRSATGNLVLTEE